MNKRVLNALDKLNRYTAENVCAVLREYCLSARGDKTGIARLAAAVAVKKPRKR